MKKAFSILIAFCITVIMLNAGSAFAIADASGTISVGTAVGSKGDTVTLTVIVSDNPGIVALRIFVSYNSDNMTLNNVENGDIFADSAADFGADFSNNPFVIL